MAISSKRRALKGTRFQVLCGKACVLQVQYSCICVTDIRKEESFEIEVVNRIGTRVLVAKFSNNVTAVEVSADATKVRGESIQRATDAVWRFVRDNWSICHGPVRPQRVKQAKPLYVTQPGVLETCTTIQK